MRGLSAKTCLVIILCIGLFGIAYSNQTIQIGDSPSGVALISQDQSGLILEVKVGSIDFSTITTNEGDFSLLAIEGFTHSQRIGEPNLPMVNRIISIPFGCELQTEVLNGEIRELSLNGLGLTNPLMPTQPSLSKSNDPDDIPFEYNRQVYRQSGYYALPAADAQIQGTMRSQHLGLVSIAPIEYDPVNNTIKVYKNLTIKVTYVHPNWAETRRIQRKYYSQVFEPVFSSIINHKEFTPLVLDDLVTYPIKYVIIADHQFENQLQPFIEWKTKKGFHVITGYTSEIGYTSSQIKDYIEDLYENVPPDETAPSFVLFVGDSPQIPPFSGDAGSHITDLRYCEFTGDDMPEIYYGRFSAQNLSELQPQIDKTLEYEQYTMPDPSYLAEVTLISGVDAGHAPTYGNGQINYGTRYYFNFAHGIIDHTWLYPESDNPGASSAIIQTVDEGVGYINYTAHCSHNGFADPSFTVSDINSLDNDHMYLLGVGNCCLSNTFAESTPCFGEAWLQAENKGGVGYIGGTNSTYWDEDYWWGVGAGPVVGSGPDYEQTGLGAYDGVFHDHGEPVAQHYITNDAMIFRGNLAVMEAGSGMSQYYWEIYTLMGDPSVMNYMGIPTTNNITHDPTILMTAPSFTVAADPGSYVGISFNGEIHGVGYVDVSGIVNIELVPFPNPGTADIVVTAQNREPYISTITVITPDGPYVVYDTCVVNDESGNNDGFIDFGERILLDMQLVNVGPDEANEVSATLSSADSCYVIITDDSEYFGDIAGDFGTVNIDDAYAFDVSNQTPDGEIINFNLEVVDSPHNTWNSQFSLQVHAPVIDFVEVFINDDDGGNGNGIFEAGETITVTVTLANNGSSTAGSVTGTISENDEYVTIPDGNAVYGNIDPNQQANNSSDIFTMTADDNFPAGHSVLVDMAIEADGGYTADAQFNIRAMESFEYNNGYYVGNGTWEWGIPSSGPGAAYDGDKVWGTVLGGEYPNNADDNLLTPCLSITSSSASISFYHWYNNESGWDGGNVQATADGGLTWAILTPDGGYPDPDVTGLDGEPGFSGESGGWQQVNFDLSGYNGQLIQLKLRFGSDGSVTRDGWYIDGVILTGAINWGMLEPSMNIEPASFVLTIEQGEIHSEDLAISNTGTGILNFTAAAISDDRLLSIAPDNNSNSQDNTDSDIEKYEVDGLIYYNYTGLKDIKDNSGSDDLATDAGGPDAFGYIWIDSDEPNGPTYEWVDITGYGIPIYDMGDDTNVGPFDIGFEFPFYGNTFTSFNLCSNGWLSFTSSSTEYLNESIPNNDEPYNLIAPFWDDLTFTSGGELYYYTSPGGDSLIVSYINVQHYSFGSPPGPYTFQIILLDDGNIIIQYADINNPVNSNTIGIQNESASIGLQVAYNTNYAYAGLAVKIKHPTFWLTVSPNGGTLMPDESTNLEVVFDGTEVGEGLYTGQILINSNDPNNLSVSVPCSLTVGQVDINDENTVVIPISFALNQNYPNPFNPTTEISFGLPSAGHTTLEIYDIMGRKVKVLVNENLHAGTHQIKWDSTDNSGDRIASGIYFYKLTQGKNTITRKMVMLK
ncbi:MAG: immune inhibitor A [candidate division Zixibacteria bacterium]|nr:immune inhibitor A [candidate division Zixibacteria bacterium]